MFGYISMQALSVAAQRRPEVAVDAMRDARRSGNGPRQALGLALVAIGQRVAGEMPSGRAGSLDVDAA